MSGSAHITVRLSPRADRDELVGIRDGVLHARVCAPPVGGEANRALCRLIALPTLNLPAAEASLALGAFVFQQGLLQDAAAGDIGLHRAPLQQIIGDPAAGALERAGVTVLLRWRAERGQQVAMSPQALRERYLPALAELLPAARDADVELFVATKEHAATFAATPGTAALRPPAATPVRGLAVAGAWTATGWPATLEGATLSGLAAAKAVLADR